MGIVAGQVRCVVLRTLYILLFPLAFLLTAYTEAPENWRYGIGNALGAMMLFGLGFACVNAIAFGV